MKRILTLILALTLIFVLNGCNGNTSGGDANNATGATPLKLDGGWKQRNSDSDTNYHVAMIADGTIEVYWRAEDNSTSLYWAGTYTAPTTGGNEYSWDSANDKSRTEAALLASSDDTKTFTYKDGIISYSVSALGVTKTFELERSDEVNIEVQKAVATADLLPLELGENAYVVSLERSGYEIQYALSIKNPNKERGVEFPTVRITARDAEGAVLGTEDIVEALILPDSVLNSAGSAMTVESEPATVDFEILPPDDYNWIAPEKITVAGEPLIVENPVKREDQIVGEISNPNDFDIESVSVVVFFRDDNGKLVGGESGNVDDVKANGKTPFEVWLYMNETSYITENMEVFAYPER